MSIILADTFHQALVDAGVITVEERVRRVIIDAQVDHATMVYVERFGDERLLRIAPALTGMEIHRDEPKATP
jgi:hypothetical protein